MVTLYVASVVVETCDAVGVLDSNFTLAEGVSLVSALAAALSLPPSVASPKPFSLLGEPVTLSTASLPTK